MRSLPRLDERLVDERAADVFHVRLAALHALDHAYEDDVVCGVVPEPRPRGSVPEEGSFAFWQVGGGGVKDDGAVVTVAEAGPPFALAVAEEEEKASPCRCRCRPACRCGVWCGMASSRSGKRQSKGLGEVQVGCSRQAAVTCGKRHLLRTHRHHQERAGMGKGQRVAIT